MAECFSATSCANWIITCSSFVPTARRSLRMQIRERKNYYKINGLENLHAFSKVDIKSSKINVSMHHKF